jgi:hypothetical protein
LLIIKGNISREAVFIFFYRKERNMMKKTVLGLTIVVMVIAAGCGGGKSALAGTWFLIEGGGRNVPMKCELLKDGTGFALDQAITWKTEKNRVYLTHPYLAMAFDYKLSGSKLSLTDDKGQTLVYTNKLGEKSALVGTWTDIEDNGWDFDSNGTLSYSYEYGGSDNTMEYPYVVDGKKLIIHIEGTLQTYAFSVSAGGKTASLTEGTDFYGWNTAGPGWSVNQLKK